ncbi:MAG: hypothetical protein WBV59_01715 [Anaerolineae bacterium]
MIVLVCRAFDNCPPEVIARQALAEADTLPRAHQKLLEARRPGQQQAFQVIIEGSVHLVFVSVKTYLYFKQPYGIIHA